MSKKRRPSPRKFSPEILVDRVNLYDHDLSCPNCEMLISLDSYDINLLIKHGKCDIICEHCNTNLTCHLL